MEKLLTLLQRRLIELECYRDMTRRLVYEPVDNLPDLLKSRDELLSELSETGKQIDAHLAANGKDIAKNPEIGAIEQKIAEVTDTIKKDDKKIAKRIKDEMNDTLDLIKNSEKTGRVASYIRKTTANTSLGRSLNTVS
jgi:ribosomal protein S15P/S13E